MAGIECPECGTGRVQTFDTGDAVCENNHNFDVDATGVTTSTTPDTGRGDLPTFNGYDMDAQVAAGALDVYLDEDGDVWVEVPSENTRDINPTSSQIQSLVELAAGETDD